MSIILATSRGADLADHLPFGTTVKVMPGAKLQDLKDEAKKILPPPSSRIVRRQHVYFLCGVPDLSTLQKNNSPKYRECIYNFEPLTKAQQYQNQLRECRDEILRCGALPIFATIPKFNLEIYNNHLLAKNYTTYLQYQDDYKEMQTKLNTTIDSVNTYIYSLNKDTNVSTPFIHCSIMQRRGSHPNRYYVLQWEKFRDGLHASKSLSITWAEAFNKSMDKNCHLEDSDNEGSPKRSWRNSKRQRVE